MAHSFLKKLMSAACLLGVMLAVSLPEAQAQRQGRDRSHKSKWKKHHKNFGEHNAVPPPNTMIRPENGVPTNGERGNANESSARSENPYAGSSQSGTRDHGGVDQRFVSPWKPSRPKKVYSGDQAQAEYFKKVAGFYEFASSKSLAVGVVTTAEGLGRLGGEVGEGEALVAAGLKSLEAGEEMKKFEQEALEKIQSNASAKEVDEELMADPVAEEVLNELAGSSGYSKAEVIEKILNSNGSINKLAQEFEKAAERKTQIELAQQATNADTTTLLENSRSGSLRKKINFASLREALANSATLAQGAVGWSGQWTSAPIAPAESGITVTVESKSESPVVSRAPASQPEFLNLGENLPSFELEQGQSEEAPEPSLFEKVRRKYSEIGPAMGRLGRK